MPAHDPLTYLSQKAVLKYLDATKRFELLAKSPSIRSTEKLVPLKVDNLKIEPFKLKINGVGFVVSVVKRLEENKFSRNGRLFNVDQYGFQDRSIEMTPGDLLVEDGQRLTAEESEKTENVTILILEQKLEGLEQKLAIATRDTPRTSYEIKLISDLEKDINITKKQLRPYHLRRDNKKPSFTHYVKVAFVPPNGKERIIKLMPYHRKAHEVMKYVMDKFFGGRRVPIQVNTLHIRPRFQQDFRLPVNLKFVAKNLRILDNVSNVLQAFRQILDNSSFPLDSIDIGAKLAYVNDPVISATRKLVLNLINGAQQNFPLEGLSHKRVHFASISHCNVFLMDLIRHWEIHGQEIGTYYSVGNCKKEAVKDFLKAIKRLVPASKKGEFKEIRGTEFPNCVIIPMQQEEAELNVYCQADPTTQDDHRWKLKIKVLPRGSANVIE